MEVRATIEYTYVGFDDKEVVHKMDIELDEAAVSSYRDYDMAIVPNDVGGEGAKFTMKDTYFQLSGKVKSWVNTPATEWRPYQPQIHHPDALRDD